MQIKKMIYLRGIFIEKAKSISICNPFTIIRARWWCAIMDIIEAVRTIALVQVLHSAEVTVRTILTTVKNCV
jgi:hypothetical protein